MGNKVSTAAAQELVGDLTKFPAPSGPFVLKRKTCDGKSEDFRLRITILRAFEEVESLRDAQRFAKEFGEVQGYGDIYKEAQAHELVARCLVAAEPIEGPNGVMTWHRVFTSGQAVRESMTAGEIAQVINGYEIIKAKYGTLELMDQESIDEWIAKLSDEALGANFLSQLDSTLWGALLLLVCQRLAESDAVVSQLRMNLQSSGESDPQTSEHGTGSFTELPAMHCEESGTQLPLDRILTPLEAASLAKETKV